MSEQDQRRYEWLYGEDRDDPYAEQRSRSERSQPGRSGPAGSNRAPLPPPNLPPPGSTPPPSHHPERSTTYGGGRRGGFGRFLRLIPLILFLWLAFLIATPIHAYSTMSKVDAAPQGDRPAEQPGQTYLIVGSDSRAGLSTEQQQQLSTGGDGGGPGRTDTIMLLHTGSGPAMLMSIPRDSLVPVPGYGTTKINAAFSYGGPPLLVQTIEASTGIRIDDYLEIGFGGLVNVVDAVGGVEICPKEAIQDVDSGLDVQAGCQTADGATALAYARNRHSYSTQDIQRVQAQREVIKSLASEVARPATVVNPLRYWRVTHGAAESLQIGEDTGMYDLVRFAFGVRSAMGPDGLSCTVPLADFSVRWDPERSQQLFDLVKTDRLQGAGPLCTADGLPPQNG